MTALPWLIYIGNFFLLAALDVGFGYLFFYAFFGLFFVAVATVWLDSKTKKENIAKLTGALNSNNEFFPSKMQLFDLDEKLIAVNADMSKAVFCWKEKDDIIKSINIFPEKIVDIRLTDKQILYGETGEMKKSGFTSFETKKTYQSYTDYELTVYLSDADCHAFTVTTVLKDEAHTWFGILKDIQNRGNSVRKEIECPHCAELILAKARVCKHCGNPIGALPTDSPDAAP